LSASGRKALVCKGKGTQLRMVNGVSELLRSPTVEEQGSHEIGSLKGPAESVEGQSAACVTIPDVQLNIPKAKKKLGQNVLSISEGNRARSSVVVKALCYKPEGRGFDTRCGVFLNLPNKKKCSGSGTGCTQPREYKLRSYLIEK
jgi:hypothetical protein